MIASTRLIDPVAGRAARSTAPRRAGGSGPRGPSAGARAPRRRRGPRAGWAGNRWTGGSSCGETTETPTIAVGVKLIIQIPCLNEEGTLPQRPGRAAARGGRLRRGRVAGRRRRLRPTRTVEVGARARRRPPRPADQQQGARRRLPGRPRRGAQARRRRDRQHRRRQPVPGGGHPDGWSRRSSPAAPTWWSATGRSSGSSTSRRPRSCSSGSGAGSCAARPGTDVPDTTSGFRAYNREAALQLIVVSNYTYTLESLIQAGKMLVAVEHVPISTNPQTRESRLCRARPPPTCAATRSRSSAPTSCTSRCGCSRSPPAPSRSRALAAWMPVPARLDPERRPQRPHPVADPGRRAGAGRGADVRRSGSSATRSPASG